MIMDKKILEKANTIIKKRRKKAKNDEKEKKYVKTCVEAGICPKCGEELKITIEKSWFEDNRKITYCPVNENHYKIEDYDCFLDDACYYM